MRLVKSHIIYFSLIDIIRNRLINMEALVQNKILFLLISLSLILSACGAGTSGGAADTVEAYITALASKDEAALLSNSCADYEDDALLELDSFALVEVTLDGMACSETGEEGNLVLVDCTGTVQMSYNGEPQELDLSTRTYEVTNENGNWLVCGTR
jgi:hypothetical protein